MCLRFSKCLLNQGLYSICIKDGQQKEYCTAVTLVVRLNPVMHTHSPTVFVHKIFISLDTNKTENINSMTHIGSDGLIQELKMLLNLDLLAVSNAQFTIFSYLIPALSQNHI